MFGKAGEEALGDGIGGDGACPGAGKEEIYFDRELVRPEPELRRRIWRTVGNPGVILYCGRAVGIWTARKTGKGLQVKTELWEERSPGGDLFNREICDLAEQYAAFWQERLYF